jgi:hypothetical protein
MQIGAMNHPARDPLEERGPLRRQPRRLLLRPDERAGRAGQ